MFSFLAPRSGADFFFSFIFSFLVAAKRRNFSFLTSFFGVFEAFLSPRSGELFIALFLAFWRREAAPIFFSFIFSIFRREAAIFFKLFFSLHFRREAPKKQFKHYFFCTFSIDFKHFLKLFCTFSIDFKAFLQNLSTFESFSVNFIVFSGAKRRPF